MTQATQSVGGGRSVARSILLVVLGSALTPLVGALSGPILARNLGVDGRGVVAAATAPLLFALAIGTFGLPEAMTFRVASDGSVDRRVVRRVLRALVAFSALLTAGIFALSPVLADHDRETQHLMWWATLFLAPALIVLLIRGVAAGLQRFRTIAVEQTVSAGGRAAILIGFVAIGQLHSFEAMLSIAAPLVLGGVVYLTMIRRHKPEKELTQAEVDERVHSMYRYGRRVWIGSIGGILLFRLDQLVVAPLSNVYELGLYVVAVNVAEILLIAVNAVHDVTFATDAASNDNDRAYATARFATLATIVVGGLMAATAPVLVPLLFGQDFRASVDLVWILVVAIIAMLPGSVAGALLTARDRPGLRSTALIAGAVVNAIVLVIAVPSGGAYGAAWATLAGNVTFAGVNIFFAARHAGAPPSAWFGFRRSDLAAVRETIRNRGGAK